MFYLTKLTLNPRHRQALRDLASPYEMHRTLMRAFPSAADGGPGRVLFRAEPQREGQPPVVLVQSVRPPDWSRLPDDYATVDPPKHVSVTLRVGQRLRFRLRANPTVCRKDVGRCGLTSTADQLRWLSRKGQSCGFQPLEVSAIRAQRYQSRRARGRRADDPAALADGGGVENSVTVQTHLGVDFEGLLEVTNPESLVAAIVAGIGPAKGYGFGLLSLARS